MSESAVSSLSRPSRYERITLTVRFVTPAFLGNAEQQGQWRTPPFKALLRQWWRIAAAREYGFDFRCLREAEGLLFGNAWLEDRFCRSQVRLRLDRWNHRQSVWNEKPPKVKHPEVKFPVDPLLYLGYGPLNYAKQTKGTVFQKPNAALQTGDSAQLGLVMPAEHTFRDTLQLIQWFGTVGSRSRNGWGSMVLHVDSLSLRTMPDNASVLLKKISRPLDECLQVDWPHALGMDQGKFLLWCTKKPFQSWQDAMKELATIKIKYRTNLNFNRNQDAKNPLIDERHILAYPVTHHGVRGWCEERNGRLSTDKRGYLKQTARLSNQLRFKVIKEDNQYRGLAFHFPCGLPPELRQDLGKNDLAWMNERQLDIWRRVHTVLDEQMDRI